MTKENNTKTRRDQYLKIGRRLFLAGVVASTAGCQNMIRRGQSPDELPAALDKYESKNVTKGPRSIGDICGLYGLDSLKVYGIGLATGLKGTGSAPIESGQREHLIRELKLKTSDEEVEDLVTDKNTELVILEGSIAPGAREGDRFDLHVVTMTDSNGTSIENGQVLQSRLRKMAHLGNRVKQGKVAAVGKGSVAVKALLDKDSKDSKRAYMSLKADNEGLLQGVVLGGGKVLEPRALSLRIRGDDFDHKTALQITYALNQRFEYRTNVGRDGVAEPKSDRIIELHVPGNYRNNIGRYASVMNQLVFAESESQRAMRLSELEATIGNPVQSSLAAMQLEAIGEKAVPALKRALKHHAMEVRFHAAEALAYLGQEDGVAELVDAARQDSTYRWHAFAALASLESRVSANTLASLFDESDHEMRYGAFRALRQQNADDPLVQGEFLANDFYLHEVNSAAAPLVHFSKKDRAEIVVFGETPKLDPAFLYVESGLTIRGNGDGTITLTGYTPGYTKDQRVCSTLVTEVIRSLADMEYGYGQQLKVLKQASEDNLLSCDLAIGAAPKLNLSRRTPKRVASAEQASAKKKSSFDSAKLFDWMKPKKK